MFCQCFQLFLVDVLVIVGLEVHWRAKIKSSPIESTYNGSGECMVLIMFFRVIHSLPPINNVTYVEIFLCSLKYFTSVL